MAGIANPGLTLKTCTTSIFNRIKDKSDTTLYFVTPDVNNNIAGITNMQAVSLYRGENIIEDSNVIFVRDSNLPTYLDTDSETIYYRHHCMESHAQSLTSTITGAPGQKLYVLFIDSIPESPTYNQIIDAFMYIWQTELSSVDSKQFTAAIKETWVSSSPATSDIRNWDTAYEGVIDGAWSITEILEDTSAVDDTLGTFIGVLSCSDKKLGEAGVLKIALGDIPPGVTISENIDRKVMDDSSKIVEPLVTLAGSTLENGTVPVDIVLEHFPVAPGSIDIESIELDDRNSPIHYTDVPTEDAKTGNLVYLDKTYGTVDYVTGTITITSVSFKKLSPTNFASKNIRKVLYRAATGPLVLNITKTTNEEIDGVAIPDIFTLYTGHAIDAKSVLEADHDVLTPKGCWLGFCIKNDTTDLFQIIDKLYFEVKHVESQLVESHERIMRHWNTYRENQIIYRTIETETENGAVVTDESGNPVEIETARIIIDGSNGNLTIGSNTNIEVVENELLTDDSPDLSHTPILPYNVNILCYDLANTPTEIFIKSDNPHYFEIDYKEHIGITEKRTYINDTEYTSDYFYELQGKPIALDSIEITLEGIDKETNSIVPIHLTDDVNGLLVDDSGVIFGNVNYETGQLQVDTLLETYIVNQSANITYNYYTVETDKVTLIDSANNYWGQLDLNTGIITGDLKKAIEKAVDSPTPVDRIYASYSYTVVRDEADTLYMDITPEKTSFYQQGTSDTDADGNFLREPATVTIEKDGDIFSANHYPNVTQTYDIGSLNNRWNQAFVHLLDAKDLAKSPILKVTDIVPYNGQPNNTINIGTRNGSLEAVQINIASAAGIQAVSGKFIYRTSDSDTDIEFYSDADTTKFHAGIITFLAADGSIDSGTHRPNDDAKTCDLGTADKRWRYLYSESARLTNLYTDTIQANTSSSIDINSDLRTHNIVPQADATYTVGTTEEAYNEIHAHTVNADTIESNATDVPVTVNDDLYVAQNIEIEGTTTLQSQLIANNDATFNKNIEVKETAVINNADIQTLRVTESAKLVEVNTEDGSETYRIGEDSASLVVIGKEGTEYRAENTLLGVKSSIIGDETDSMSDFTMHGIKKYLDYTADTLAQTILVDFTIEPLPEYLAPRDENGELIKLSDIEAINATCNALYVEPVESNIAVVKRLIAIDSSNTDTIEDDINRYSYTGYVYNKTTDAEGTDWSNWQAMSGNYSAEDVYFTRDFKFTGPVGVVTQTEINNNQGYTSRRATGRSLQDFMYDLFAQAKNPNVVQPTYKLSATPGVAVDNEVGNYITSITWNGTFTSGSYEYGSVNASDTSVRNTNTNTAVTATYQMSNSIDNQTATAIDGTFTLTDDTKIQIDSISEKTYAQITGKCSSTQSPRIPINNLHDPVESLRITAKDFDNVVADVKLTGHRKMFYGSSASVLDLTSDNIRNQLQGNATSGTNSIDVTIVANASHVLIALPAGRKLTSLVNPDSKIDLMTVAGTITTTTLVVEGANNFGSEGTDNAMTYTIYEYKPAAALGANTYTATIANG